MPVGIIKTIAESRPRCPAASSIGGVPATDVIAYATSNAARVLRREGDVLEEARPADLVLVQQPVAARRITRSRPSTVVTSPGSPA